MGFFPKLTLEPGKPGVVKYKFLIADNEMPSAAEIEKSFDQFTGATTPSAVPPSQTLPAEKAAPAKPKTPAKAPAKPVAAN